jgi:YfiR/HmsC-like
MRPQAARRRPGPIRATGRAAACVLLCAAVAGTPRAQNAPPANFEHDVKASFVYTVAKFVEWPPEAFVGPGAPFIFVVVGDDRFEDSLEHTVAGKSVGGHPIEVVGVKDGKDLVACHVLFLGRSEAPRMDDVIQRLRGASVLTVSDFDQFAQSGGVMRLALDENMVRFEINVDAAARAHLQISSKILKLGRLVRDRKHVLGAP